MSTQYKNYKFKIEEAINKQTLEAYQGIKIYKKKSWWRNIVVIFAWWREFFIIFTREIF